MDEPAVDLTHHGREADPVEGTDMPRGRRSAVLPQPLKDSTEYSKGELRELARAGYDPFGSWRFAHVSEAEKRRLAQVQGGNQLLPGLR